MRLKTLTFVAALGSAALFTLASSTASADDEDKDLVRLGQSLLPTDTPAPRVDAGSTKAAAAVVAAAAAPDAAAPAPDAAAPAEADEPADAGAALVDTGGAPTTTPTTTASPPEPALPAAPVREESPAPSSAKAPIRVGPAARKARIESGQNSELKSLEASPIAAMGVPAEAVPVVATAATVGTAALWPFIVKTLTGILKSIFAGLLKNRAKKGEKIAKEQKKLLFLGFALRPSELLALLLGALIYGLAICYSFQGWGLTPSFLLGQEALVVLLYYSRSFVRFAFERRFNLPTQFKFWISGGMLCLVSTYLGTTLGTVGYELEEASSKEDTTRIVKLKAMLTGLALVMALTFFAANLLHPTKILQTGRVMMSGMALAEILPITPMPGKRIYGWNKGVWALLAVTIIPSFVLINYFL